MQYDLSSELDRNKAVSRFEYLLKNEKKIELAEKRIKRGLSQNAYAHVCLTAFAIEYGDTIQYVKQELWKKQICPSIFKYERVNRVTGEVRTAYKSSADLDTKEMTIAIDMLRDYASREMGLYIGEPKDMVWVREIQRQEQQLKQYL